MDKRKFLSNEEKAQLEENLLRHVEDDTRNAVVLLTILYTGARPQEVLSLSWSEIDVSTGEVYLATLKGGRPRFVVVPRHVRDALMRLKSISGNRPFNLSYSRLVEVWNLYRPVKKTLRSMRHSFALRALQTTKNIHFVQRALGHRSMSSTMVYLDYDYTAQEFKKMMRVR